MGDYKLSGGTMTDSLTINSIIKNTQELSTTLGNYYNNTESDGRFPKLSGGAMTGS